MSEWLVVSIEDAQRIFLARLQYAIQEGIAIIILNPEVDQATNNAVSVNLVAK